MALDQIFNLLRRKRRHLVASLLGTFLHFEWTPCSGNHFLFHVSTPYPNPNATSLKPIWHSYNLLTGLHFRTFSPQSTITFFKSIFLSGCPLFKHKYMRAHTHTIPNPHYITISNSTYCVCIHKKIPKLYIPYNLSLFNSALYLALFSIITLVKPTSQHPLKCNCFPTASSFFIGVFLFL